MAKAKVRSRTSGPFGWRESLAFPSHAATVPAHCAQDALFDVTVAVRFVERLKRSGEMVSISWKRGAKSIAT